MSRERIGGRNLVRRHICHRAGDLAFSVKRSAVRSGGIIAGIIADIDIVIIDHVFLASAADDNAVLTYAAVLLRGLKIDGGIDIFHMYVLRFVFVAFEKLRQCPVRRGLFRQNRQRHILFQRGQQFFGLFSYGIKFSR